MSAIVVLPVVLPALPSALPIIASAVGAAAGLLGFAAVSNEAGTVEVEAENGVEAGVTLEVDNADLIHNSLALGQEQVFVKGDITVRFKRDLNGDTSVSVHGEDHTEEELQEVGQQFVNTVLQQYAYHQIVTELKNRDFNMVDQEVDEDGTVRLHVRTFQG